MSQTYRALSVGQAGPRVRLLQARLLDFDAAPAHDELVEGMFGASTRYQLIAVQQRLSLPATGVADPDTVRAMAGAKVPHRGYVVGLVLGPAEEPVAGITVRAYDRDIRSEQDLGTATSGPDGYYQVVYAAEQASAAEAGSADVAVRAFRGDIMLIDPPMADTLFNAPPLVSVTVRLTVATPPELTEYERIVRTVEPLLAKLAWTDLAQDADHQDLTFLSGETGLPATKIAHVAVAQRLTAQMPTTESKIPPYFFYAIFAADTLAAAQHWASLTPRLAVTLASAVHPLFLDIVLLPAEEIGAAVEKAVATFLVPRTLTRELPKILQALAGHRDEAAAFAKDNRQRILTDHAQHLLDSDLVAQVTGARHRHLR